MKFLNPVYNLLSITAILVFIPYFFYDRQTFDLHIHDTYFIIQVRQFLMLNAFVLLALWMIYKLCDGNLSSLLLTKIHVIVSVITIVLIATAVYWGQFTIRTPGSKYYPEVVDSGIPTVFIHWALLIIVALFVIAQLVLIINVVSGLIKK